MQKFHHQISVVTEEINKLYSFILVPYYFSSILPLLQSIYLFFLDIFHFVSTFIIVTTKSALFYVKNLPKEEKNHFVFVVKTFVFLEFCWMFFFETSVAK
jgi:hypothetical protein